MSVRGWPALGVVLTVLSALGGFVALSPGSASASDPQESYLLTWDQGDASAPPFTVNGQTYRASIQVSCFYVPYPTYSGSDPDCDANGLNHVTLSDPQGNVVSTWSGPADSSGQLFLHLPNLAVLAVGDVVTIYDSDGAVHQATYDGYPTLSLSCASDGSVSFSGDAGEYDVINSDVGGELPINEGAFGGSAPASQHVTEVGVVGSFQEAPADPSFQVNAGTDAFCPAAPSPPTPPTTQPPSTKLQAHSDTVPSAGRPVTYNVLKNDDGTGLSLVKIGVKPQHGKAICASNGSCTYTPNKTYEGHDSFSYTVTDGSGTSSAREFIRANLDSTALEAANPAQWASDLSNGDLCGTITVAGSQHRYEIDREGIDGVLTFGIDGAKVCWHEAGSLDPKEVWTESGQSFVKWTPASGVKSASVTLGVSDTISIPHASASFSIGADGTPGFGVSTTSTTQTYSASGQSGRAEEIKIPYTDRTAKGGSFVFRQTITPSVTVNAPGESVGITGKAVAAQTGTLCRAVIYPDANPIHSKKFGSIIVNGTKDCTSVGAL